MQKEFFIQKLYQIIPKSCVLADKEECYPYECDGLSAYTVLTLVSRITH